MFMVAHLALYVYTKHIDQGAAEDRTWAWSQVASVFTDWKTYLYTLNMLFSSVSAVGVTLALPSIIAGLGQWSNSVSLALTTPPYVVACFFVYIGCWSSGNFFSPTTSFHHLLSFSFFFADIYFERGYHIIVGSLIRMTGLLMLMFVPHDQFGVLYFAVFLAIGPSVSILYIFE